MNENCDYESVLRYRDCLLNMFNEHDWEWFISFNSPTDKIDEIEKKLKKWRCNMCKTDHIQICYVGNIISSKITGNHIHLLMFGRNKDGQTLLDMDETQWERGWKDITHKDCKIVPVRDEGVLDYMTKEKNTPHNHFDMIIPYNGYLLNKYRKLTC